MKAKVHPSWYPEAVVKCACGNTFTVGTTVPSIEVEVCYNCHPYYTGQMKFLDAAGRVDSFRARQAAARDTLSKTERRKIKREKRIQEQLDRPESLEELRETLKKTSKSKKKAK